MHLRDDVNGTFLFFVEQDSHLQGLGDPLGRADGLFGGEVAKEDQLWLAVQRVCSLALKEHIDLVMIRVSRLF